MRVAIIAEQRPSQKQLITELAGRHELVGVIHPSPIGQRGLSERLRKVRSEFVDGGVAGATLRVLGVVPTPWIGWHSAQEDELADRRYFPGAEEAYANIDPAIVHNPRDVNDQATVELLKRMQPDAVVCLGGPIYRAPLIEAAGLMINFHAGISPLYNGAGTIDFAFANGHPHLCGGTLMIMNTVVDGGDILAHYLPSIDAEDTPATLKMKTIGGGIQLFESFLNLVAEGGRYVKCSQTRPLFYYRGRDWTLYHGQRVRHHLSRRTAALHLRQSESHEYFRLRSDDEARVAVSGVLSSLLGLTSQ